MENTLIFYFSQGNGQIWKIIQELAAGPTDPSPFDPRINTLAPSRVSPGHRPGTGPDPFGQGRETQLTVQLVAYLDRGSVIPRPVAYGAITTLASKETGSAGELSIWGRILDAVSFSASRFQPVSGN